MRKVIVFLSLLTLGIFISSFSEDKNTLKPTTNISKSFSFAPTEEESYAIDYEIPFIGNSFNGFKDALAFKESQGKYHAVNSLGYLGKYQFGKSTLERFRIYNTQAFLNSPKLQEKAFLALCSLNKWILRKDIRRSTGKTINGVLVTESGILAAAHLAGAGNVKKYLRSDGKTRFKDAYGSSVLHYIKKFSGYDTSFIEADRKPVIKIG